MAITKVTSGLISADASSVDLNIDAGTLYIDATNNRVGIGTTSPTTALDVTGTATMDGLTVEGVGFAGMNIQAGATSVAAIDFGDSSDTNIGGINYNNANDTLNLRSGNLNRLTAAANGDISFYEDTATTAKLFWDASAESLGIGTTSPSSILDINANAPIIRIESASSQDSKILFVEDGNAAVSLFYEGSAGAGTANNLHIRSELSGSETNLVTFGLDGNVGINRTSPNGLLHMQSNSGTDSALYIQTSATSDDSIINFGDNGGSAVGKILYQHSSDSMQFNTQSTERMRIDSSGRLLLGATSSLAPAGTILPLGYRGRAGTGGTETNNFNIAWTGSVANLWIDTSNLGAISTSSDYRIKRNVETQTDNALSKVMKIRPVTYQMNNYKELFKVEDGDEIKEGFIAHELAEIIPSAVMGKKDDPNQIQSLKLDALVSVLTKAIQEQQALIEAQATTITDLTTRIEILENA